MYKRNTPKTHKKYTRNTYTHTHAYIHTHARVHAKLVSHTSKHAGEGKENILQAREGAD